MAINPLSTRLGRFELRQTLGKSGLGATWLAWDDHAKTEVLLYVPRAQLSLSAYASWRDRVQDAARLKHPGLPRFVDMGREDGWPYVAYTRGEWQTLGERLAAQKSVAPLDGARWICGALDAVAYAHEAGVAHLDLGLHTVLINSRNDVALLGLAAGLPLLKPAASPADGAETGNSTGALHSQRQAAERDLLMAGLLLHRLLAGAPALDDPDLVGAADRVGREIVRLPWTTPQPVHDTLRAVVNRATDRQQRQRYLSARTLLRALSGWVDSQSQTGGGPLVMLLDRLNSVGHLPGRPGLAQRVASLSRMEGQRIDEMVELIVQDPGLVCEILRSINSARYHGRGDGQVTSVRRAVLLMGLQGVSRASGGLRTWPGALVAGARSEGAVLLSMEMKQACTAGLAAEILCPPGTDAQEALVAAMFQHLGRMLVYYHFSDEALQIVQLMQSAPPTEPGGKEAPGMSEEAATAAVLGIDMESLGVAVAKQWGLDEGLQHAMRRLNPELPVRKPDERQDVLRAVASLANEALSASVLPAKQQAAAFHQVVQRYARPLNVDLKEVQGALVEARRIIADSGATIVEAVERTVR